MLPLLADLLAGREGEREREREREREARACVRACVVAPYGAKCAGWEAFSLGKTLVVQLAAQGGPPVRLSPAQLRTLTLEQVRQHSLLSWPYADCQAA